MFLLLPYLSRFLVRVTISLLLCSGLSRSLSSCPICPHVTSSPAALWLVHWSLPTQALPLLQCGSACGLAHAVHYFNTEELIVYKTLTSLFMSSPLLHRLKLVCSLTHLLWPGRVVRSEGSRIVNSTWLGHECARLCGEDDARCLSHSVHHWCKFAWRSTNLRPCVLCSFDRVF